MFIFIFPSGPLATNAILIGCPHTKKGAVIDPSLGSTAALLEKAKELGLKIGKILLTHSHWDHFADAHELKLETGAPLYVHPLDAKNVEDPGSDHLPLYVPIESVSVDHFLDEGDEVEVGTLKLKVIHTPGHCPGSVCFYLEKEKVLFAGDTLFAGTIGTLALPTAEPQKMIASLKKLSLLPRETRVISGHGQETTIGREVKTFQRMGI